MSHFNEVTRTMHYSKLYYFACHRHWFVLKPVLTLFTIFSKNTSVSGLFINLNIQLTKDMVYVDYLPSSTTETKFKRETLLHNNVLLQGATQVISTIS